jgi:hypothetical protein
VRTSTASSGGKGDGHTELSPCALQIVHEPVDVVEWPDRALAIQEDPSFPNPYSYLAACYAHMDRLDDAREIIVRLRAPLPLP